ncbi:hypothetical protein FPOA_11466 [Fusarium poae]|uniref:Uncharacterized protein n=1 Tax=Fusarium poae TaxID=36050 RepID=A0A1B8AGU2_FUSPO|nr:hypothetical protein FPOA_11466 [Fusarium poae]
MAPPRCIVAVKPQDKPSEIELQFSHLKYAELYSKFLDRKKQDGNGFSFTTDLFRRTICVQTDIARSDEANEFVLDDMQDASRWAEAIGLCRVSGQTASILEEIEPAEFKELLHIPPSEWNRIWGSAVDAARFKGSMVGTRVSPMKSDDLKSEEDTSIKSRFMGLFSFGSK